MQSLRVLALALIAIIGGSLLNGCSNGRQQVSQESYLTDTDAFALDTVVGLIKGDNILDADALELTINNANSGINNVDIDKDGDIDFVQVEEVDGGTVRKFNFIAIPSSTGKDDDGVIISTVTLKAVNDHVTVEAGYPSYIRGYDNVYYADTYPTGLGFSSWAFRPMRTRFVRHSYVDYHYTPYHAYDRVHVHTTRNSYTQTTRVSPIPVQRPPKNFAAPATPRDRLGRFASPATRTPPSDRMGDRAGSMTPFQVRDVNKPKADGSSVRSGASPASPRPASRPAAPPSRPSGGSSRPARGSFKR